MKYESNKRMMNKDKSMAVKRKGKIRERNYENILNAAETVFSQFGFRGASINAIAEKAKLPKANIHYYFASKKSLYMDVLSRIVEQWNRGLEDIHVGQDPAQVLENYIALKVTLSCEKPYQSRLFASEIMGGAECLEDYLKTDMRHWVREKAEVFQAWMDQGKMRQTDPVNLLFMIWAATQHYADYQAQVLLIKNRIEYDESDMKNIVCSVTEMVLLGLNLKPSWLQA